jgi:hypothetical protein
MDDPASVQHDHPVSEPPARRDLEKTVAGLVDVVRILTDGLGHANSVLAKIAIGEPLTEEDAGNLDAVDDALHVAVTVLERVGEFVDPDVIQELRRGGGL